MLDTPTGASATGNDSSNNGWVVVVTSTTSTTSTTAGKGVGDVGALDDATAGVDVSSSETAGTAGSAGDIGAPPSGRPANTPASGPTVAERPFVGPATPTADCNHLGASPEAESVPGLNEPMTTMANTANVPAPTVMCVRCGRRSEDNEGNEGNDGSTVTDRRRSGRPGVDVERHERHERLARSALGRSVPHTTQIGTLTTVVT